MSKLTLHTVREELKRIRVRITRSPDGELRVCLFGRNEDSAYYTNDLQDALDTGRAMDKADGT
jgi:hypothetical protein